MKICSTCSFVVSETTHNFCPVDGSPLIAPDNLSEKPLIREVRKFKLQSSPRIEPNTADISDPLLSFNISRFFQSARNEAELYEITRGFWKIFQSRANRAKYALAVYRGEIKEIYEIERWEPARVESSEFWIRYKREQGEEVDLAINNGRFQFVGQKASDEIRAKYLGKLMPDSGSKFPVNYFNC